MKALLYYFALFAVLLALVPCLGFAQKEATAGQSLEVYNAQTQQVMTVDTEEYLAGVVAAEMPAGFETEALKAQAVAARTFIERKVQDGEAPDEHRGAPVCTEPTHCKAWVSKEEAFAGWGDSAEDYWRKITSAVNATTGEILVYEDEPILAVFHAMSGGKTASSAEVWGGDVPYLQSVDSPGDVLAPRYETGVDVSFAAFREKILTLRPEAVIESFNDIGDIQRSEAGYVQSVTIGGQSVTGAEMRSLFGLRSANFSMVQSGENLHFDVRGYGHGVGMSQYGADYYAGLGKTYEEILEFYYRGARIKKL